jgi:glycosyltransferase involved in cell wall biosynthesis
MPNSQMTLLCLAHLDWDHVWQRPQQIMTRLTKRYDVWYVDPPHISDAIAAPELRELSIDQGVRVLRPFFPAQQVAQPDGYWEAWYSLLPELLRRVGSEALMWVFSPYADGLVERAKPSIQLAVYDCMDDLASFKGGSPEMRLRESNLLGLVDLVFTGGHSMYEARKELHPRVYCFPSGVDIAHYQQVQSEHTPIAAACASIPHPQLGYFGVLDERIDWELIAAVAARRPNWHWVLVGPTAKVDPSELPKAANIHYLGKQPYAELPSFLKSFDIATMPFALNEATTFISPTKTLEYLAGGKPVISSSVADVVAFYSEIVAIADGADAWISAVEALLAASPAERRVRNERAQPLLAANTWDAIAARMADLVDEQLR